jgi:hypothetical protein
MLHKACGQAVMKKTQTYGCHKRFRDGRASVNCYHHYGSEVSFDA